MKFLFLGILLPAALYAGKAHVHGGGELKVAKEGETLEIQLELPGMGVVGFENKPKNSRQKKELAAAVAFLKAGNKVFSFPKDANCKLVKAKVEHPHASGGHAHHDHHDHHDDHAGEHSEFEANYQFRCSSKGSLPYLSVNLFSQYKRLKKLNSVSVSKAGQKPKVLTPNNNKIQLN